MASNVFFVFAIFHMLSSDHSPILSVTFLLSFCFSVIPNCQFRSKTSRLKTFTANQLDEIKDPSGLFYILPFQKVREHHYRQIFSVVSELPLSLVTCSVFLGLSCQLGCSEKSVGSPVWKGDI